MQLYNDDCFNVLPKIPAKSVDLVLCDLPYGVTANKEDVKLPLDKLWEQYKRILKPNGCVLLFGQGKFFAELVNSNTKWFRYDLVWDKILPTGFLNANRMPLRAHEQIAVFYNKMPTYNPQFEIGNPLHSKGTAYLKKPIVNRNYGSFNIIADTRKNSVQKYPKSIVRYSKPHPSKSEHATQKPVSLLRYLVRTYTNEGDLVLDNCMGTGGTAVACFAEKREFIGIEKNEYYFQKAQNAIRTLEKR